MVQSRLKILRQGGFPGEARPGAGVGEAQLPGVQQLTPHQGFEALSLGQLTDMPFPEGERQ